LPLLLEPLSSVPHTADVAGAYLKAPCIASFIIDGAQCTLVRYIDDTKISHLNPDVVIRIIGAIQGHFGKMNATRGREHTFLAMNIMYTKHQPAKGTMKEYLGKAIAGSGSSLCLSLLCFFSLLEASGC
jgi:hypothetical protein